jgi:tetratricopeptide (TPR) repeat protein
VPAVTRDAKSEAPIDARKKKKQSVAAMQRELSALSAPPAEAEKSPIQLRKSLLRVGLILAVVWAVALVFTRWSKIPLIVAGALTLLAIGLAFWVVRYVNKSRELGALLRAAGQNEDGRKDALRRLETDFKKGDVQAVLARAQLEMHDDAHKALATLESVDLGKQLGPVADQVRCTRATIHLQLGQLQEARALVDKLEFGKQQEPKTRAMFAAVVGEAWGRTGQGKKAVEILEVFNPEEPGYSEMRVQMWRARAFAYAGAGDMKGASRALRKLADMNPQLLGMFVGARKVHPLLQQEAKQLLLRSGAVPKRMVRERM